MCKEMPVIPVNKVVDLKIIIRKMEGQGSGEAQGVADQKRLDKSKKLPSCLSTSLHRAYVYLPTYLRTSESNR
jgi:hypothetical protein